MTNARIYKFNKMLRASRLRLCAVSLPFAIPLLEMYFVATSKVYRISTNGKCIYFNPDWLQKLDDDGLDLILAHQLMHIHLGHLSRPKLYKGERFHLACDIVANAKLEDLGFEYDEFPCIGKIYKKTFFPEIKGDLITAKEAFKCIPFDPATLSASARRGYMIDSDEWWDEKDDRGEQGTIVVDPEDNPDDINDVFFLPTKGNRVFEVSAESFDSLGGTFADSYRELARDSWEKTVSDDLKKLRDIKKSYSQTDSEEQFFERTWDKIDATSMDWRQILQADLQSDVKDYTFTPPDRRYGDLELFLPDYNTVGFRPKYILLFVDTSASVTDRALDRVYREVYDIVCRLDGAIAGQLVFFDSRVYTPVPFDNISTLQGIKPQGGGATDFNCIFEYAKRVPDVEKIVVFTDGNSDYPPIEAAGGIPVLWVMTGHDVTAPWGKTVVID